MQRLQSERWLLLNKRRFSKPRKLLSLLREKIFVLQRHPLSFSNVVFSEGLLKKEILFHWAVLQNEELRLAITLSLTMYFPVCSMRIFRGYLLDWEVSDSLLSILFRRIM